MKSRYHPAVFSPSRVYSSSKKLTEDFQRKD
jgi:hypothetical protein